MPLVLKTPSKSLVQAGDTKSTWSYARAAPFVWSSVHATPWK
jgi:hypothetical protein